MSMAPVSVGAVDVAALTFAGDHFKGEISPAVQDLVDPGIIGVIDSLFAAGRVSDRPCSQHDVA